MNGKITFMSYEDALKLNQEKFDIKLQIVRFTKKGLINGFIHVPQLAPSEKLFKQTMYKWKKNNFSKVEYDFLRNGKTGTWFDLYEVAFLKELGIKIDLEIEKNIPFLKNTFPVQDLIKSYNRIKEHLNNGKNIVAVCYCENYKKCHRYIIANQLIKDGYTVIIK